MPSFCAAAAIGCTGNPTMPNMYSTPCFLRFLATNVAPSTSAMSSLLSECGGFGVPAALVAGAGCRPAAPPVQRRVAAASSRRVRPSPPEPPAGHGIRRLSPIALVRAKIPPPGARVKPRWRGAPREVAGHPPSEDGRGSPRRFRRSPRAAPSSARRGRRAKLDGEHHGVDRRSAGGTGAAHRLVRRPQRRAVQRGDRTRPVDVPSRSPSTCSRSNRIR